jgi:hypothetical protein
MATYIVRGGRDGQRKAFAQLHLRPAASAGLAEGPRHFVLHSRACAACACGAGHRRGVKAHTVETVVSCNLVGNCQSATWGPWGFGLGSWPKAGPPAEGSRRQPWEPLAIAVAGIAGMHWWPHSRFLFRSWSWQAGTVRGSQRTGLRHPTASFPKKTSSNACRASLSGNRSATRWTLPEPRTPSARG